MIESCYGCGRVPDFDAGVDEEGRFAASAGVRLPSSSRGPIVYCATCFLAGSFDGLTARDVRNVTWRFRSRLADSRPERAIELMEPLLARWRDAELLSPVGRALVAVGRVAEGVALLREALSLSPDYPDSELDRRRIHEAGV